LEDALMMDEWVQGVLENRADQSWEPMLFASPDVVEHFPSIAGMPVTADDALPSRTLQIRSATALAYDIESYAAGHVMAEYSRVPLPPKPQKEEEPA